MTTPPPARTPKKFPKPKKNAEGYPTLPVAFLRSIPAHYNPRRITLRDFRALRRSLRKFGRVEPVVVNRRLQRIVGGHMRIRAAHEEGLKDFPVSIVDLDEADEMELNVALNRIGGEWDPDRVPGVIERIVALEGDVGATGFSDEELGGFMDGFEDDSVYLDDEGDGLAPASPATRARTPDDYGAATSLQRGSAPLLHWEKRGLLSQGVRATRILDFGAGQDVHDFARYDAFAAPDPRPLCQKWDVVMANYVLNVQPSDHLIDLILALVWNITQVDGLFLVAVVTDQKLSGLPACGGRPAKTPAEWAALLGRFFEVKKSPKAPFAGFECERR